VGCSLRHPCLESRVNFYRLRYLGVFERCHQLLITAAQTHFLEIIILGLEVDAALFQQHRHAVAGYLPGEQGENSILFISAGTFCVQTFLSPPTIVFGQAIFMH
jgi:hypothetical protein